MQWRAVLFALLVLVAANDVEAQNDAHFHHVHLNSTDPAASLAFYQKIFGAVRVRYADRTEALFTERSFIFVDRVDAEPPSSLVSPIWHLGWGGIDGPNEYAWLKEQGMRFYGETELNPLGSNYYMYLYGVDDELIEIFTGEKNHRFNHVHLFATDVNTTTEWFDAHLGLEPRRPGRVEPREYGGTLLWSNAIRVDNVSIVVFGLGDSERRPPWWPAESVPGDFVSSRGRVVDHLAFSFRDIDPVLERMQKGGATLVEPVRERPALDTRSFFALAPDGLLVEIVEAPPIPDAIWD